MASSKKPKSNVIKSCTTAVVGLFFFLTVVECADWDLGDLSHVPWISVSSRSELESAIEKGFSLVQVSVDNGTQFLHTGGDLNNFLPIIVGDTDSSPASDLTLSHALKQIIVKTNKRTGLHIKFMTASILPQSLDVLTDVMSQSADVINVPVFVEVNVLEASKESTQPLVRDPEQVIMKISQIPGVTPVLGWATYHGNDKVWKSLADNTSLTRFELLRVRRIIENLRFSPTTIKDTDVRFLNIIVNKLEMTASDPQHSFAHLVVSHLLSAIKTNGHNDKAIEDPYSPRRPYRPPRKEPITEILPDYYITNEQYTRTQVDRMLALAKPLNNVGFSVRAGMLKSDESVEQISRLLKDDSSRFIIVSKKKMDKEEVGDVDKLLQRVGRNRVLVEMGDWTSADDPTKDISRVPEPRDFSSGCNYISMSLYAITLASLVLSVMSY